MPSTEERVAVLESIVERNQEDITRLFEFLRKHMDKEDKDRVEIIGLIADIRNQQVKQKSFVGGVVFTVSSVWVILTAIAAWLIKFKS